MDWLRTVMLALTCVGLGAAAPQPVQEAPLEAILAEPMAHHRRPVRVHGFLTMEYEGQSLWATEADFRAWRDERRVMLDTPWRLANAHPLNGKRAYVSATVDAMSYRDATNGASILLIDVTAIAPDPTDTDRARPWQDDPLFLILASLGFLGLFFAVVVLNDRVRRMTS